MPCCSCSPATATGTGPIAPPFREVRNRRRRGPALTISHAACLDPEPALDGARLVELAERNAAAVKQPWAEFEVALALHRAGRFEQALARLAESRELQEWPKVWVLKALACIKLDRPDDARVWLKKAGDWYDTATREEVGPELTFPFNPGWWEQPRFQLLFQEARRAIEDPMWKDANGEALAARTRKALRPETYDHDLAVLLSPTDARLRLARGARLLELQRPAAARADFAEAAKLSPKDSLIWKERGQIEADLGDPVQAADAFSKYLDLLPVGDSWAAPRSRACLELAGQEAVYAKLMGRRPADTMLAVGLARHHTAFGRWKEAAATLGRVIESRPSGEEGYELAAFLLFAGDAAGYDKAVGRLVERFKDATDPYGHYSLARACILVPKSPADPADVVKWAEVAVAEKKTAWYLHVLAAAHFRAANYPEALKWIAESEALAWGDWGKCQNAMLRAMVQAKQGKWARPGSRSRKRW